MESLRIILDLETVGFTDAPYTVITHDDDVVIGGMARGTVEGKPIVMIGLKQPEGYLVVQTTLSLFLTAADALKAKYGDPR